MATLPPDALTHIFQYLTFNDVIWCGLVCKDWLAATNDNIFWAKLPPHYQRSERKSKRLLYVEWIKRDKRHNIINKQGNNCVQYCPSCSFCASTICCFVLICVASAWASVLTLSLYERPSSVPCIIHSVSITEFKCFTTACHSCGRCYAKMHCSDRSRIKYENITIPCCGDTCRDVRCLTQNNGTYVDTNDCARGLVKCWCRCTSGHEMCTLKPSICYEANLHCSYTNSSGTQNITYLVGSFMGKNETAKRASEYKVGAHTNIWIVDKSPRLIPVLVIITLSFACVLYCTFEFCYLYCLCEYFKRMQGKSKRSS